MTERQTGDHAIIMEAVRLANEHAKSNPLQVGDTVAPIGGKISYKLRKINGDEAVAGYPDPNTGEDTVDTFPLNKLFDVNVALRIAVRLKEKSLMGSASNN